MHKKLLVAAMLAVTASAGAFAQSVASGAVQAHAPVAVAVAAAPHAASAAGPVAGPAQEDRTVTRDEFLKKAAAHFDAMDTNHDGKLTPDERHAFFKAHVAEFRAQHGPHGGPPAHDGPPPQDAPHPTAQAPK